MNKETRRVFGKPWKLQEDYSCVYRAGKKHENEDWSKVFDVLDTRGYEHYARFYDGKTANRFMRLPELYEALEEAVDVVCGACTKHPMSCGNCKYNRWSVLLSNIEDGK